MALVIMGGLFVSTFLTSLLLPTTTTILEDGLAWIARLPGALVRLVRPAPRVRKPV